MYNFKDIEQKWQEFWEKNELFTAKEDKNKRDKKYYVLEMFPYPSGRLHMGHVRNYTIADVIARYKRIQGYYIMHPIGWDSFGLPAENAAVKSKKDPEEWTLSNISYMKEQLKRMGFSYDWSREITTCKKDYYKWNQWLFIKFFEKGLSYRKKSFVNWCPSCSTVLANEQVEDGKCWRCESDVEQKDLEQWFFKITDYKEALLKDHELIKNNWNERIVNMQKHWIGESIGSSIDFSVLNSEDKITVFTTRVDTLLGATYVVLAPEHELVNKMIKGKSNETEVLKFIEKIKKQSELDRKTLDKEGVFTGEYAIHPITGEQIPIWIGNYVLTGYGTGAVMAVPAHDQRDYEFAKKYELSIKIVIIPNDKNYKVKEDEAFEELGILKNSGEYDDLSSEEAKKNITKFLEGKGKGSFQKHFRLKDWLISRQRYWGTPIPMIFCKKCGTVPVPLEDLPVVLPKNVEMTGIGDSPLSHVEDFVNVKCPKCKGDALRETDTMDTFMDSSWYFLRYCDPKNDKLPFDKSKTDYWMPVDQYVGGAEHACMHLLYSRFFEKVLIDMGMISKDQKEPFTNLLNQGMVIKDGAKMSKSKGNTVDPDEMLKKYGADSLRLFSLFASPPHKDLEWNEEGIEGSNRFIARFWRLAEDVIQKSQDKREEDVFDRSIEQMMHNTIKRVTEDMNSFSYNTAISAIMEAVNFLYKKRDENSLKQILEFVKALVIMLNPFAPHTTEEIWQRMGYKASLVNETWPVFDESKAKLEEIVFVVQINGKLRGKFNIQRDSEQKDVEQIIYEDDKVKNYIEGKTIVKNIFVKNKLLNIVIRD